MVEFQAQVIVLGLPFGLRHDWHQLCRRRKPLRGRLPLGLPQPGLHVFKLVILEVSRQAFRGTKAPLHLQQHLAVPVLGPAFTVCRALLGSLQANPQLSQLRPHLFSRVDGRHAVVHGRRPDKIELGRVR